MMSFWKSKSVVVTGGGGFLGLYIVKRLDQTKCPQIFVPRRREYDLRHLEVVQRRLQDAHPGVIIHVAGVVGGIGANRAHLAGFFYDNLMMGVQLLHESWEFGVQKFVAIGTVCAYPKFTPVPFREDDLWKGYPEETNGPYDLAKKMLLVQSQAYREPYGFTSIFLLPTNLYGPGDNFDPASAHVIPDVLCKCVQATRRRRDRLVG
jgi:GDP-L-fucose synthase